MISWVEDINENILYLFTDWASHKVFNEKTKRKSWRYWWEWIWLIYIDDNYKTKELDLSDNLSYIQGTNNDMELKAVVDWLKYLLKSDLIQKYHKIIVVTDSDYVFSNRNIAKYYWSNKWWKNSSWFWLVHKDLRKDFFKTIKSLSNLWIRCNPERVKWHNGNEYNEKADQSAREWANSKNRIPAQKGKWIKMPFLEVINFDNKIDINWKQWLLIHITNHVNLWHNWKRYNCEMVDWENEYFRYRFYINTNKSLSSEYIYNVDIGNDKHRHIIEKVNWEFSKQEIKEKILKAWFGQEVFYKSKIKKQKADP